MNLKFAGELLEKCGMEINTVILILILFVLISGLVSGVYLIARVYFLAIKAYARFEKKQAMCDTIHNTQNIKIDHIEKVSEEAKSDSKEALTIVRSVEKCTDSINKKVEAATSFIEDKWGNGIKEKSAN